MSDGTKSNPPIHHSARFEEKERVVIVITKTRESTNLSIRQYLPSFLHVALYPCIGHSLPQRPPPSPARAQMRVSKESAVPTRNAGTEPRKLVGPAIISVLCSSSIKKILPATRYGRGLEIMLVACQAMLAVQH